MKKAKLLVLSLLAVSAIGLTSCGQTGPKGDTGEQGEKGEKGDAGTPGKDGTDGVDGKSFLNGEGAPSDTLGNDGDSYVDTTTYDYYAKENGKWVLKGNIKGEKGDTGAKGDAGEKGDKGDTGSKGDKGDTGSKGNTGSKGDTAWSNTILPFDYGYITASSGSATIDETVTFKVTITDNDCKAFKVLFDDNEVEAVKIDRTSSSSNEFEISKKMKSNGYVVRAVGYTNLGGALASSSNISLAGDVNTGDLGFASTASLFDGSIAAFSDLTTFGSGGELPVSSSVNLNLNGFNIDLGTNKIVVSSGASLGLSNSVKNESGATKKGVISSSTTESAIEITGSSSSSEESKTSLSVGSDVSISATAGTAIKQTGSTSSVTINEGSSVSGAKNGIELSGGTLDIQGGEVKSTANTVTKTEEDGGTVTSVSGVAIAVIQSSATEEVKVTVSGGEIKSDSGTAVYEKSASASSGEETKTPTIKIDGAVIEGKTETDVEISYGSVNVTVEGNGKVSVNNPKAKVGDDVILTFEAEDGNELCSILINGKEADSNGDSYLDSLKENKLTLKMIDDGYVVSATFVKKINLTSSDLSEKTFVIEANTLSSDTSKAFVVGSFDTGKTSISNIDDSSVPGLKVNVSDTVKTLTFYNSTFKNALRGIGTNRLTDYAQPTTAGLLETVRFVNCTIEGVIYSGFGDLAKNVEFVNCKFTNTSMKVWSVYASYSLNFSKDESQRSLSFKGCTFSCLRGVKVNNPNGVNVLFDGNTFDENVYATRAIAFDNEGTSENSKLYGDIEIYNNTLKKGNNQDEKPHFQLVTLKKSEAYISFKDGCGLYVADNNVLTDDTNFVLVGGDDGAELNSNQAVTYERKKS